MTETQFTDSEGVEFIPRHNTIYIDSIGGSNKLYRWDGFKYVEVSDSDNVTEAIDNHIKDFNNPHKVTAEQIGLGNVDNTADIDKPISTAVQEALDTVNTKVTEHTENKENPHGVTAEQIGLGNVDNTADYDKPVSKATQDEIDRIDGRIDTIDNSIGVPSGIATLDGNGKLTDSQIPDKTINVLVGKLMSETEFKDEEGNTYEPRTGVIYIDTVSGTEKIYRWNKYEYVEISNTELLEGALNSHVQDKNNPHQVTKEQIGLSEVTNDAQVKRSEMGTPEGVATLGEDGKIPVEQLPGQVDEVFGIDRFVSTKTDIPSSRLVIGSTYYVEDEKKIYTAISETELDEGATPDKGVIYSNRETNIIYRWDGAELVEIGNPVHLGEVAGTAYPGDKGKATTDKVNAHVADFENPHQVTKEQIGLGNVDNTSDADKPISSAVQEALDAVNKEVSEHKADKNNPHEVTKAQVGLGNVDNTADLDKPVSNATQELVDNTKKELDTKIDNHTSDFNNPHKVTKEQVGLGNVDNTADINKPVSVAQQALVDSTKAELKKDIGDIEKDVTNHIADKNNPHEVNKLQVGLGNVDNTSDINKPVSIAQQAALDKLKSDLESIIGSTGTDLSAHLKDFDNPHKVTKDQVGLGKVDNTADLEKPISTATQKAIDDAKAANNTALDNHANRTDNPHKVTKDQVGLGNVDNTADINKPVSVAQQNALDTLSNSLNTAINNHVGNTNNPHQVTKEQVGLGKVDNTSDLEKPISVATQNAISEVVSNLDKHIADKKNPHEVTKEQIGLGRVDNTSDLEKPISTATQVALDKKAELGPDGKIPESQLPERTMHSLFYKGTWDAERNLPTLANGDKAQDGDYYLVNNDGKSFGYKFMVNDIIFNASGIWYRMMGSNKRDDPTEFKITKFTADRTLLERGESTEITLEWEYQLTQSGQINFQFIDTHDIPVEKRTYKITATGGQTFTLRGSYLSEVVTATLTIDTADKVYVGASSNSAPTDSDFIAMNSFFSFGDNEFPFTPIDCSGGKYIYVAIPTEEYSKYRIYCNNYPVDDVTVYSRRITNIFTGYTDYTITKLANLYHGILNIEVKLIDKR